MIVIQFGYENITVLTALNFYVVNNGEKLL